MKNKITKNGTVYTDSVIWNGVTYNQEVNADSDLQVGYAIASSIKFETSISSFSVGDVIQYEVQMNSDANYKLIGNYIIDSIKKTKNKYLVTALDTICQSNVIVDSWIAGLTSPISLAALFSSLCSWLEVTYEAYSGTNYNFMITSPKEKMSGKNISGRTVLQWIAAMAGGFVYAKADGKFAIGHYTSKAVSINNTKYTGKTVADFSVPPIDKVRAATTDGDVGVSYGSGSEELKILDNPLFYVFENDNTLPGVVAIYNTVHPITYYPMTVSLLEDHNINCGDIVTVDGLSLYVMKKEITASGVTLQSVGNSTRGTTLTYNQQLSDLKGRSASFTVDLDGIKSRVTSAEGDINQIEQTLTGVAFTSSLAAGTTVINGGCITTGTISAARIDTSSLSANSISVVDTDDYNVFTANASTHVASIGPMTVNGEGISMGGNHGGCTIKMNDLDTMADVNFKLWSVEPNTALGQGIYLVGDGLGGATATINDFNLNDCELNAYTYMQDYEGERAYNLYEKIDEIDSDLSTKLRKPVLLYDKDSGGLQVAGSVNEDFVDENGLATTNNSASHTITDWNITGINLSLYKYLRIHWNRVDGVNDNCTGVTDLDLTQLISGTSAGTAYSNYLASDIKPMWANRNRSQCVQFAVNSAKSAFGFIQAYSLYGTAATTVHTPRITKIYGCFY